MTRFEMIGAKMPIELFDDCLALYGEFLMAFHNLKQDDYEKITDELRRQINDKTDDLKPIKITQIKLVLNEMFKRGVQDEVSDYLQIVDLIDFEPILVGKTKVETKPVEVEKPVRFCQKCREPKGDLNFSTKNALICRNCISKQSSDIFEKAKIDKKTSIAIHVNGEPKENPKPQLIDEKLLPHQDGKGIYKIAIIHKDRITGELSHSVFEFESESREAAVGCAVLSKQVKNEIIISIGYEKSLLHSGH